MKKILLLLALLLPLPAAAQTTYRYATRDTCDLLLDVYRPAPGSDSLFQGQRKPTVLFVFGGGFIMGSRNSEWHKPWLEKLSQEGYGAVAIDYRLGMKGYRMGKGLLVNFFESPNRGMGVRKRLEIGQVHSALAASVAVEGDSIFYFSVQGGNVQGETYFNLKKHQWTTITATVEDIQSSIKITFSSTNKHRFFLDDVCVRPADPTQGAIRTVEGSTVDFGLVGRQLIFGEAFLVVFLRRSCYGDKKQ